MRDTRGRSSQLVGQGVVGNQSHGWVAQSGISAVGGRVRGVVMLLKSVMLMALACAAAPMLAAMAYVLSAGL